MNRFVFANPKLCIGCDTCLAACAAAHMAEGLPPQPRLTIIRSGKVSMPITCRHCDNAPCAAVCPVNAVTTTKNGVAIDETICNGCQLCVPACPFGVIVFSSDGAAHQEQPADKVAVKCDICDFSKGGPECVRACPTDALFLVDTKSLRRSSNAKRQAAVKRMPPLLNHFLQPKK